ncbi:MAG: hypothetical protein WD928_14630 [Gammaproteobacteria bacterium]
MTRHFATALLLVLLAGFAVDASAYHRSRFDFYFGGGPMWWGYPRYYWPDPYFYQPRTIIIEREPPVYIQRPQASAPQPAPATASANVWYYCTEPAGYYPYVQNCTRPWVSVDPSTVAPPPGP